MIFKIQHCFCWYSLELFTLPVIFSLVTAVTLGSILISFQVHSGITVVVYLIFMRYNNMRKREKKNLINY